jgi:hypothetical protein
LRRVAAPGGGVWWRCVGPGSAGPVGQRLTRDALLVTAVIIVGHHEPLAEAMADAYAHLGHTLDPRTVGSVSSFVSGVTLADVTEAVGDALAETMPLDSPDLVGGRLLLEPWDPR